MIQKFLRYASWRILLMIVRILSNSDEKEKNYEKILHKRPSEIHSYEPHAE